MKILTFETGPFMENTYLLIKEGKALLIDPGFADAAEYSDFKKALGREQAELAAVILTHAHVDHVLGLDRVLSDFNTEVYLNTDDLYLWNNFGNQARLYGFNASDFAFTPEKLPSDRTFNIGPFHFICLHTPGHAPEHTAFYFEEDEALFAGDALFRGSIGRTDLYKGDFEVLKKSIQERIYTLPERVTVYPGHGPSTTVGHEKSSNPFVRGV